MIEGEFVGAIVGATGAGIEVGIDPTPVTKLFAPCPSAPGTLAMVSRILSGGVINENCDVDFRIQVFAIGVAHVHEQSQHRLDGT